MQPRSMRMSSTIRATRASSSTIRRRVPARVSVIGDQAACWSFWDNGSRIRQTTPSGAKSSETSPSNSRASPRSTRREPKPRRSGGETGEPPALKPARPPPPHRGQPEAAGGGGGAGGAPAPPPLDLDGRGSSRVVDLPGHIHPPLGRGERAVLACVGGELVKGH